MISLKEFEKNVIDKFTETITDRTFIMIEQEKELLQEYLDLLGKHPRKTVNSSLAKAIKKRFDLKNKIPNNKEPKSLLIKSFTEFD